MYNRSRLRFLHINLRCKFKTELWPLIHVRILIVSACYCENEWLKFDKLCNTGIFIGLIGPFPIQK